MSKFLDSIVCSPECAISNPDDMDTTRASVLAEDTQTREAAFDWARTVIGKGGTYGVEALAHGVISDDQEIQDRASYCVGQIREGKCPKYVIAGEEFPEIHRGIKSRGLYQFIKDNLMEE